MRNTLTPEVLDGMKEIATHYASSGWNPYRQDVSPVEVLVLIGEIERLRNTVDGGNYRIFCPECFKRLDLGVTTYRYGDHVRMCHTCGDWRKVSP